jgi:hypothetical protein
MWLLSHYFYDVLLMEVIVLTDAIDGLYEFTLKISMIWKM